VIREDETLGEVKERLQKKLQVPDEEFAKVGCYSFLEVQETEIKCGSVFPQREMCGFSSHFKLLLTDYG
jgi:hypothetical protein